MFTIQLKLLLLHYKELYKTNHPQGENNSSGFSFIEVLVSSIMALIILTFALGAFNSMRQSFVKDEGVVDVNSRLKTIFGIMGPDMQQIGQGIADQNIPLIELKVFNPNTANERSEITITKTSGLASLSTQQAFTSGQTDTTIPISQNDSVLAQWKGNRVSNGGKTSAYIFNSTEKEGEFFEYVGEDSTVNPPILKINHTWTRDYPSGSAIYLMDKRKYEVKNNQLLLTVNDTDEFKLAQDVEKIKIYATITNINGPTITESICKGIPLTGTPTNCNSAVTNYNFSNIKSLEVSATVKQGTAGNDPRTKKVRTKEDLTMSQQFFIRNTLN